MNRTGPALAALAAGLALTAALLAAAPVQAQGITTEYIPLDGTIHLERTTIPMHVPADNPFPWGHVRGTIQSPAEGYDVIIQVYQDGMPVHLAQVGVQEGRLVRVQVPGTGRNRRGGHPAYSMATTRSSYSRWCTSGPPEWSRIHAALEAGRPPGGRPSTRSAPAWRPCHGGVSPLPRTRWSRGWREIRCRPWRLCSRSGP